MRGEMEKKEKTPVGLPTKPPNTPVRIYSITWITLVNQVLHYTAVSLCHCQSELLSLIRYIIYSLLLYYIVQALFGSS